MKIGKYILIGLFCIILYIGLGFALFNFIQADKILAEAKETKQIETKAKEDTISTQQIIINELTQTGKLITYEGKITYIKHIEHKGFLNSKEMDLELKYKFGLGIDFSKIIVNGIKDNVVTVSLPKNEIKIYTISYLAQDTKITSSKTWLAKQFTPEEVDNIFKEVDKEVYQKIANTPDIFEKAYIQTKDIVDKKINEFGYRVVFE